MAFLPKNIIKKEFSKKTTLKESFSLKIFIGLTLLALLSLLFPSSEFYSYEYKVGTIWTNKDLIAPFSFSILKEHEQYEKEKLEAVSKVYKVFNINDTVLSVALSNLGSNINTLKSIAELSAKKDKQDSVNQIEQLISKLTFQPETEDINIIKSGFDFNAFEKSLTPIVKDILSQGITNLSYDEIGSENIALRKGTVEIITSVRNYFDPDSVTKTIQARIFSLYGINEKSYLAIKLVSSLIEPTIIFNSIETDQLIEAAKENVPRTVGFVQQNERIVSKHERISAEIKEKLESLSKAKADRGSDQESFLQKAGVIIHSSLILLPYLIYLFLFRKQIYHDNSKLLLIAIIILMQGFFAFLTLKIDTNAPLQYLIFLPASSMLLTIIFDSRVGFYGTVVMAFLIAAVRGNDYEIALAALVAGTLATYTVRNIRLRTQIFRSLIFIFVGYFFSIVALALQRSESISLVLQELTFAFANSVFSPVLTFGLLIFFEKSFKVTTDLTLLELSDQNHPLLKMLREKAPGTFHHSMTIGTLAETAADAIRANAILARVGAYYHDIGKTIKPEYFAENEMQRKSRHQRLTARMSSLVIISHVKEGMELAREYGLPESVINFIPQHHGTTKISYFYEKALKQATARQTKGEVREEDYRYPGPKPQSKEAGIVMLADVVEAVTRTIEYPTPQKLESVIDERIKNRFIEGQLDECELTLRDLTEIKQAFVKILIGIYHQRIKYPEQREEKPAQEEKPAETETKIESTTENNNQKPVNTVEQSEKSDVNDPPAENPNNRNKDLT